MNCFSRCTMKFLLTINSLRSKDRNLKNLLVFSQKIEDLTFFSSTPSKQRGKRQKLPFEPRLTLSAKIEHVGVYFAKMGCKIEYGFTDIFGFQLWRYCVWSKRYFASALIAPGAHINFAAKRKRL